MVDLFTNVKGSGFATPIPGGAGGGTPATAKLFNGNGYNGYEPTHTVSIPYTSSYPFRMHDISDPSNPILAFSVNNSYSGYPATFYETSSIGKRHISKDGYLYCLGVGGNSLHVIDATSVSSMQPNTSWIAEYASSAVIYCHAIQGHPTKNLLWMSSDTNETLFTVDISNPASPVFIGSVTLTGNYNVWRDFCISYDGEYAFIRDGNNLYRAELDGLNAPTNLTDIASSITTQNSNESTRSMSYIEDPSGLPHLIMTYADGVEVFDLDSSYNVTNYAYFNSSVTYDDMGWVSMLPYGYNYYPTAKFAYWGFEEDDTTQFIEVFDGSSMTRIIEIPNGGNFLTDSPVSNVDSWDNYIFVASRANNMRWRIYQWDAVNSMSFVSSDPNYNYYNTGFLHAE